MLSEQSNLSQNTLKIIYYSYFHSVMNSQYIFSLLLFLNKNKNQFQVNSEIYHCSTRQKSHLHQPSVNLTKYQKGVYYLGVKVFNKLPTYIKEEFDNTKKFKKKYHRNIWMKSHFTCCKNTSIYKIEYVYKYYWCVILLFYIFMFVFLLYRVYTKELCSFKNS
jgi:hypothetical protein